MSRASGHLAKHPILQVDKFLNYRPADVCPDSMSKMYPGHCFDVVRPSATQHVKTRTTCAGEFGNTCLGVVSQNIRQPGKDTERVESIFQRALCTAPPICRFIHQKSCRKSFAQAELPGASVQLLSTTTSFESEAGRRDIYYIFVYNYMYIYIYIYSIYTYNYAYTYYISVHM